MKHKLQNLLKHKLQWLLLLVALLGVSQGVWGESTTIYVKKSGLFASNPPYIHYWGNCSTNWPGTQFSSTTIDGADGKWYTMTINNCNVNNFLLHNNSGSQTGNISRGSNEWYVVNSASDYHGYTNDPDIVELYVRGIGSWDPTNDNKMSENDGVFTLTTDLNSGKGYSFKIGDATWGSHNYGKDNLSINCDTEETLQSNKGNISFTPTSTGSHTFRFTLSTKNLEIICPAPSCTTPTANDITISAPASATTLYLGTGSAPSVDQTVTATCSKGNTYLWSATPTTYTSSSCWPGTATRVAFTSASSKSTTATFYHEGVYTATFAAGCGNTTDASNNAPIITVKPGHIYFDGPFFSGSGYDLTKHHLEIDKSNDEFVYEWTATSSNTVAKNDFIISVGNQCINATTSAYDIGNYADLTLNGLVIPDEDTSGKTNCNHNFRANIGTIAVGERLKLTVTYTGVNSSGVPKYTVKLEKVCSNPTAQAVSGTAAICSGSSTNVTVASSQSGYTYKLYKGGSATTTTKTGTGSALNFPVSEAGTYTVHAYYTSGSDAYCKADMTGSAIVTVTPTTSIGSVTLTSSSVCIGEGLSAKANSVVLGGGTGAWSSSNTSIATVASTGVITPKAAGSTNITYTITGGCGGTVSKYATLTVKPNAAAAQYTLTNNTQTYNGAPRAVTVTPASGAGTATIYYTGTGGTSYAKSTTAPINAGTYAITVNAASGTNYCAASDLSVGTLTVNKANQSTLTISNTATDLVYCDAANVKLTTSGGSGDGAVTYTVTSGSGSVDGDVLSPSAKGSVSVTATKAASQNFNATTSEPKTFNFNKTAPTVYTLSNVGDATTICGDPSSGAGSGTLRLANSQTGYKYQLYSNGSPIEGYAAKAGTTGSSIDFPVTSSGTYTVYAYYGDNSTNCPTRMDGEITLTISTQPKLVRSAASVTEYMPVTITSVSTDIAKWKITDNTGTPDLSSSTAYLYDKTYDAISFKGASTNGSTAKTYTIQATTAGGCSETTTVTVNPDTESCSN